VWVQLSRAVFTVFSEAQKDKLEEKKIKQICISLQEYILIKYLQ